MLKRVVAPARIARITRPAPYNAAAIVASRRAPLAAQRFQLRMYSDQAKAEEQNGEAKQAETAQEGEQQGGEKTPEQLQIEELKTKLEEKDKEAARLRDGYTRAIADFRNLQETTKREIQKAKDFALQKFAKDLLDSVDNFDRALTAVSQEALNDGENNAELKSFYDGVKMTQDVFEKTLARHGLSKLNPLGEQFDPNVHEATFEVPQPDKEPGTVFHVQQSGFSYNGRVIRAPKVGVVKGE